MTGSVRPMSISSSVQVIAHLHTHILHTYIYIYTYIHTCDQNDWKCAPDEHLKFCPSNCTCGAEDTGENACFAPDIDHTNVKVQVCCALCVGVGVWCVCVCVFVGGWISQVCVCVWELCARY